MSQAKKAATAIAKKKATAPCPATEKYACRQELVEMAKQSDDPQTQALGEQLEQDIIAEQHAKLAQHTYNADTAEVPEGWSKVTATPQELEKYGMPARLFRMKDSDFRAEMYVPDSKMFGNNMHPTIAFKGTDLTPEDVINNIQNGIGLEAPYYKRAEEIGLEAKKSGKNINFTGHSLGGGLASTAAIPSGTPTTTFNAAGVGPETLIRMGFSRFYDPVNINAYSLDGDILTYAQEGLPIPEALGNRIRLPSDFVDEGPSFWEKTSPPHYVCDRVKMLHERANYHGIDKVLSALQEQRTQTQKAVQEAVGKQCP